jgi:hypothetical protein
MASQAMPAATMASHTSSGEPRVARATVASANTHVPPTTRRSMGTARRSRGKATAPATDPIPSAPSSSPKPVAPSPNRPLATTGSRAQRALAGRMNRAVRTSTARSSGAKRT